MSNNLKLAFRNTVKTTDIANVVNITKATEFFNEDEILIAKELIEDAFSKGINSDYNFIFAEYENKMVGYSCFGKIPATDNRYDLYWIAVLPEFQKKNIGSLILKKTEDNIKKEKGRHIYIETSSKPEYQKTRNFYLKNQYLEAAVLKDFYRNNDSKIIYFKKL